MKTKLNFGTGTSRTVRVSSKIGLHMELTAGARQIYSWKACAVGVIAYNPNTFHTDLGRIIISKNRPFLSGTISFLKSSTGASMPANDQVWSALLRSGFYKCAKKLFMVLLNFSLIY